MLRALIALLIFAFSPVAAWATEPVELADAAEDKQWDRVAELLGSNFDPNAAQVDGMTALHWAAWHDDISTVTVLLASKAQPDCENRYAVTPLHLACVNGSPAVTSALLDAGADCNRSIPGGETPLMTASRTGRLSVVEALLLHGAKVDATEQSGQTALMWAAAEGNAEVVQRLIDAEADPGITLGSGFSAMSFAVREGKSKVVEILLASGLDVNEPMRPKNSGGRRVRNGTSPLMLATENGHFELAVELLQAGADANDMRSGFTPLHALTWVRKPNRGDGLDGQPSPIGSGRVTSLQLARQLVAHGADVNKRLTRGKSGRARLNHAGATPFLFAADTADVPLMRLLLELGADWKIPNNDNCPPLLAAAGLGTYAPGEEAGTEEEAIDAVKLLLDLGADINVVDDNGETAMHGAAYKSLPKMVDFLFKHGADIEVWNRKNKYGWTPHLIAEGHRAGNFRPAHATLTAIQRVMRASDVAPPPLTPRKIRRRDYESDSK